MTQHLNNLLQRKLGLGARARARARARANVWVRVMIFAMLGYGPSIIFLDTDVTTYPKVSTCSLCLKFPYNLRTCIKSDDGFLGSHGIWLCVNLFHCF